MDVEQIRDGERDTGEHGMHDVERERGEHEGELERLAFEARKLADLTPEELESDDVKKYRRVAPETVETTETTEPAAEKASETSETTEKAETPKAPFVATEKVETLDLEKDLDLEKKSEDVEKTEDSDDDKPSAE